MTATNPDGTVSVASVPSATIQAWPPRAFCRLEIAGDIRRTQTLRLSMPTYGDATCWDGPDNTYSYQWQRSSDQSTWTNIAGATGTSYVVASADVGDYLRATETATNPDATVTVDSGEIGPAILFLPLGGIPTITGTPQLPSMLTGAPGTWQGIDNTYAYRWLRCDAAGKSCQSITGATSSTYKLAQADEGATVRLAVTAIDVDGGATDQSNPTAVITG